MTSPPFIPQMQPWLDECETNAVHDYMAGGGWLTEFKKTADFAQAIAQFTGSRHCSITSNGTVSLTAALIALGIGRGDEVVVPAYTMIASATAVLMAQGAVPVFADVEPETMCLDLAGLKSALTPRTRAVMLVSINGRYPRGLEELLAFCRERGLPVVEDAAQSLGSFHRGRHVGTYGAIGSFSFSMPKIITTGQGGALVTDNEELYKKIELVRNFGRENPGVDRHVFFGANFKFTDLQAVVGIEQMKKLAGRIELKKKQYRFLRERLAGVGAVRFFQTSDEVTPWFNDILVPDPAALQAHLKSLGIGSRPFYPCLPTQAPFHQSADLYPHAREISAHGLWLPSYSQLTDDELERIAAGIASFYA
jgi:perosamine synthetase